LRNDLENKYSTIQSLIQTNQQLIETNNQLIERARESNIIIQSLQQAFNESLKQLSPNKDNQLNKGKKEHLGNKILYLMATIASIFMLIIIVAIIYKYFNN
jgi:hypothetical protein